MASKDKNGTDSLHNLMATGVDTIPKEYHRKLLKKIAQLTKVIYALNTQNEDHEDFVAKLRSLHDGEIQRLLLDSSTKLQRCEESFFKEKDSHVKRIEELRENVGKLEAERDRLHDVQVSYRKEVDIKLQSLKSEHVNKVQSLTRELEKFKSDQAQQLREVSRLKDAFTKTSSEQMKELKLQHKRELEDARERSKRESEALMAELDSQAVSHTKELQRVRQEYEGKLSTLEEKSNRVQSELLSDVRRKWEDHAKVLQDEHSQREEQLKNQISTLTDNLRSSKDRLALAEQRIKEMEASFEENMADSSGLRAQLREAEQKANDLQSSLSSLSTELDIAKEQYRQQSKEMQQMSVSLGKLEALRVSNEGVINNLRSQIASLQEKLQQLEMEKASLLKSERSSNEQLSVRLKIMDRELEKVRREKQELHAQFAKEIEAAHAQLSQRETELGTEHLHALKQLREEHSEALSRAAQERETALEELKRDLTSQHDEEQVKLSEKHAAETSKLNTLLTDRSSELDLATEELKRLQTAVAKSEQGLGSATGEVEKLRSQVGQLQGELSSAQRQLEGSKKEISQLKVLLESLKQRQKDTEKNHHEEMKKTKDDLTHRLEDKWKERLKHESALLRQELSQRHDQDTRAVLSELANLKDNALKQANHLWEDERTKLLVKNDELMKQLKAMHDNAALSLQEAKLTSDSQITSLRQELDDMEAQYKNMLEELKLSQENEMSIKTKQSEKEKADLSEKLKSKHTSEVLDLQKANALAVTMLREDLQLQQEAALHEAARRHREEMNALRDKLTSQFQSELSGVREDHRSEVEKHRQQLQEMLELRHKETSSYERTVDDLHQDIEGRDAELSKLRDRVNTLTVSVSDLRKELEVKGHEVLMIRREANNRLHLREQELSSVHRAEMESVHQQHRQESKLLLADFNQAKILLNSRLQEMERQISEWQRRYQARDSKPEDLEIIRELKMIVREQEQRMKEFNAEKKFYQLELMNREKNYNKIFNAHPHVGVLDPLNSKKRKVSETGGGSGVRYSSAPSLVSPLPADSQTSTVTVTLPSLHPPHQLAPLSLTTASGGSSASSISSSSTSGVTTQLFKNEQTKHSPLETKPRKVVMLQDSPLSQEKLGKIKNSRTIDGRHTSLHTLEQAPPSIGQKKPTLLVQ